MSIDPCAMPVPICGQIGKMRFDTGHTKIHKMHDKRRHQRIRFGSPPSVTIGYEGTLGSGTIENLSLSGLMLRTELRLEIGYRIGCEFSLYGSPTIDLPAVVVSRLGDLFGVRFDAGLINGVLLNDAIATGLGEGHASVLTMHEIGGNKLMRIAGGLNGSLHNDVMHSLTKVGVDEIDVSRVTAIEAAGMDLCLLAHGRYGVRIGKQSECFAKAWREFLRVPGEMDNKL